uniref:Uncharacterized protein n=1 Tax=Anguilla anguilla TaxID=7936 RepID=A0A0E9S128_ANGAN
MGSLFPPHSLQLMRVKGTSLQDAACWLCPQSASLLKTTQIRK